jgi:hypothetical protein
MSKVKILKMMEKVGLPPFMDVKDISLITEVSVQTYTIGVKQIKKANCITC